MRPAVAALFLAAAVLVCGCAMFGSEEGCRGGSCADPDNGASTGRVVCGPDGTRVVTPQVAARPGGVRFVIDNRFGADTSYSVKTPDGGGMGDNAPKGNSEHVEDFPPGTVRIGCEEPPVDGMGTDYASLSISRGDSGYKRAELECPGGQGVTGVEASVSEDAKGEKGDPVGLTRRAFSDRLEEDDAVGLAGYPESEGTKDVRVVRGSRVTAVVAYTRWKGGWIQEGYTACSGF